MAGCCPKPPVVVQGAGADRATGIQDNQPLPGETADCFMATANNPTGMHHDATGNVANKIDTTSISLNSAGNVDTTFKLQSLPAGEQRTPTSWSIRYAESTEIPTWSGVAFTSAGPTARLFGVFSAPNLGKTFKIVVSASDAAGLIDKRGYTFSPAIGSKSSSIQFIHPLPGSVVTSRFSIARLHPNDKIVKPHKGCDFAYKGGKLGPVLAAADGEVVFKGVEPRGAGNYIKIKHVNAAGEHLCTTVYMHLDTMLVAQNQKVIAGQVIGQEGNTGHGTGAHLHFECRLPNDTRIDPEPLIRGSLAVAQRTNADNSADPTSLETRTSDAVLTPENARARSGGCAPFGPGYPNTVDAVPITAAPATTDLFELAWALTMATEVIAWQATPPTDQEVSDGLISTKTQRRKVGYVNHPKDPGGETKFGIAQVFNKNIKVTDVKYQQARDAGYSSFWNGKRPSALAQDKPRTAIAIFNIGFLCGLGGANTILTRANISALSDVESVDAVCNSMKAYLLGKVEKAPSKAAFKAGWLRRVEQVRSYCKSLPL